MSNNRFDVEGFFSSLDIVREERKKTWKQVATEARVAASTLTRIGQGRRPDVDGLAALCSWADLDARNYYRPTQSNQLNTEALAQISALLRADRNLSREGAVAMEQMLKSAYQHLRKNVDDAKTEEGLQS